jgi:hypothetical protein
MMKVIVPLGNFANAHKNTNNAGTLSTRVWCLKAARTSDFLSLNRWFPMFRRVRKIVKSDHQFRHVCLFACNNLAPTWQTVTKTDIWLPLDRLSRKLISGSHLTDCHENWYLAPTWQTVTKSDIWLLFENLSKKLRVSLKSDKNNDYFTRRPMYIYDSISPNSF